MQRSKWWPFSFWWEILWFSFRTASSLLFFPLSCKQFVWMISPMFYFLPLDYSHHPEARSSLASKCQALHGYIMWTIDWFRALRLITCLGTLNQSTTCTQPWKGVNGTGKRSASRWWRRRVLPAPQLANFTTWPAFTVRVVEGGMRWTWSQTWDWPQKGATPAMSIRFHRAPHTTTGSGFAHSYMRMWRWVAAARVGVGQNPTVTSPTATSLTAMNLWAARMGMARILLFSLQGATRGEAHQMHWILLNKAFPSTTGGRTI